MQETAAAVVEAFHAADLDGNGTLDRGEIRTLALSLGVSDDAELEQAIAQMGADGDNEISQSEFVAWWQSQNASSTVEDDALTEAFRAADLDGNGTLDRDEIRKLALSLGVPDDESLEAAIAQMDADGDNEITFAEFSTWWRSQSLEAGEGGSGNLFSRIRLRSLSGLSATLSPRQLTERGGQLLTTGLSEAKVAMSAETIAAMDDRDVRKLAVQQVQKQKQKVSKLFGKLKIGSPRSPRGSKTPKK